MGWLGTMVLITICIYPLVYCFLAWLRLIPARWAGFLEAIPFMGFGIWLAFIAYLAALTEFGTVSVRLRPGLSEDKIMSICNEAQAEGIPMTIAFESKNGDVAWINASMLVKAKSFVLAALRKSRASNEAGKCYDLSASS